MARPKIVIIDNKLGKKPKRLDLSAFNKEGLLKRLYLFFKFILKDTY